MAQNKFCFLENDMRKSGSVPSLACDGMSQKGSVISSRSSGSGYSNRSVSTLSITMDDCARMKIGLVVPEKFDVPEKTFDPEKLKSKAKMNQSKFKCMKREDFQHVTLKLNPCPSPSISSVSSAPSSTSSGSSNEGTLSGWGPSWTKDSSRRLSSLSNNSLSPNGHVEVQSTVGHVRGCCFLRNRSGVVVTEPRAQKIQVFSSKRGATLVELDRNMCHKNWSDNFEAGSKFLPTGVCETDEDNVLAVTDRNKIYYLLLAAGSRSAFEGQVSLKDRINLQAIMFTNQGKMVVLDSGQTNKPYVGMYDSHGKVIREFKGKFTEPSQIAWNDFYQIAAIVDCGQRKVLFYDTDGKLINSFSGVPSGSANQLENNHLSYPTGVSWTSRSQLFVADKGNCRVLAFDFRAMKSENALDATDGLKDPVLLTTNETGSKLLVSEEEYSAGRKDVYRLKFFRRHGVPKTLHEGLFL